MVLIEHPKYTYPSGKARKYWQCSRWPKCGGLLPSHPSGQPYGIQADDETKQARILAHIEFDKLWKTGKMTRTEAYIKLSKIMNMTRKQAHISRFTKEQCFDLINNLKKYENT